jgi:hypothetical protein
MRMVYWVLNLGHPLLRQEKMGVNEEQGRGFSCRGATFRACFPWQPQLSKKRDFLPIMFPHDFVQYSPLPLLSVKRKKTFPKLLSGLGNARGTDRNRRASDYLQDDQRDRQTRSANSSSAPLAGLLFCVVYIEINQVTSTAGKPQGRLDVLICLQKLFPWYTCLGADGSQGRAFDFAMIG